jgi:DNA-binding transcriptional LysR family regulator|tara:strand:+ start:7374 stop:8315 length:942 start_codon:yes stop_codon:yes gene_type:complete
MSRWDGIDEFLAVAAAMSFTGGARALGMSTTHVSRAVIKLEQRLDRQLFHRTTRKVGLTDAGRAFLERCERIAQDTEEAFDLMNERGEPRGLLRVTCSTAIGERFVAPLILGIAAQYPKLAVSIELTNSLIDLVADGFDLAVRSGPVSDSRLISTHVASRKLYTCASPAYLAREGRPVNVDSLASHECIVGTNPIWNFKVAKRDVHYRARGRFACNSGHAVIEACVAGFGICQLPDFYVLPYLRSGMVELLLEDARPDEQPIWAVYPQRRHLAPNVHLVVESLRSGLRDALDAATSPWDPWGRAAPEQGLAGS